MVFFSCNSCGESLKKNQVEKHCYRCRQCEVLSCVDCGKEFWGDGYKQHIKCMTEEEKYSGKNYQPKANANKGEKKQLAWCEQVQQAIDSVAGGNYKLKSLLEKLCDCPNVPRKQKKFENFARSSLRVYDQKLLEQAWEAINSKEKQSIGLQESKSSQGKLSNSQADSAAEEATVAAESQNGTMDMEKENKLSKRERKEERRKQKQKLEKKDKKSQQHSEDSKEPKHNRSKRKREDMEGGALNGHEEEGEPTQKKKKKKSKEKGDQESEVEAQPSGKKGNRKKDMMQEDGEVEEELTEEVAAPAGKFQWEAIIIQVLSSATNRELSLKRLQKKVLAEYHARDSGIKKLPEEKLWARFNKKVTKNPRLKVLKDKVKLD